MFLNNQTENMQKTTSSQRNAGLDFLKGICILLVVLDHAVLFARFPDILRAYITGTFLNVFFIVSGYLLYTTSKLSKSDIKGRIKRKFISLFTPYLFFSIITILWHIIICVFFDNTEVSTEYFGLEIIKRDVFCMVSGIGIGTLWFLPVLFVSYTFLLIISYIIKNKNDKFKFIILGLIFILLAICSQVVYNSDFSGNGLIGIMISKYINTIYRILYGTAYTILGYLIHVIYDSVKNRTCLTIAFFSVIISIIAYFTGCIICFQCASCLSLSLICIIAFDSKFKNELTRIFKSIIFCGQNSLAIMIWHYLFLLPIEKALIKSVCCGVAQNLQEWILFIFNLITTLVIVYFLKDNYVHKRMLGQKR